jgi:branched-chain amino acid transport system permease protein
MPIWLRVLGYAALAAAVIALPHFVGSFTIAEFTYVAVYALALFGLNILTGITGQISLGQGAFMLIGAYTTGILSAHHGWPQLLTVPAAALVAGIAGFLFGFPALRLAGVYLALATFALAVIVPSIATAFDFTGGSSGILLALPTSPFTGQRIHVLGVGVTMPTVGADTWLYYVSWGIAAVGLVVAFWFVRGKRGRALRAIMENELAATASGVSLSRYKTLAFGVSAAYAGAAGALFGILSFIVTPGLIPVTTSILLLAGLVVGGARSFLGAIIGAIFVELIQVYSADVLGPVVNAAQQVGLPIGDVDKATPGVPSVVYGVILLVVLFLMPRGAAGLFSRIAGLTRRVV